MTEWRDIPGYEGKYQVSSAGEVKSLCRPKECILRPGQSRGGYKQVNLRTPDGCRRTRPVHQLVAEAFLGPRPFPGAHVCHNDGAAGNNDVTNLRWGSASENARDQVRHGTHPETKKTHCPQRHEYTPENTYLGPERDEGLSRRRYCLTCLRKSRREATLKSRALQAAMRRAA